jgi:DNA-binding response OmpR family regulator
MMFQREKKLLAVDDNPVNLEIVAEALAGRYRLRLARSGADAIHTAKSFQPDVVLLDVMMPCMDGLETCRQLRAISGLENCVIVMVSAKAMPSEKAAGIHAGADDYITKPFDERELLAILERHNDRFAKDAESRCGNVRLSKTTQ